ncbi:archaemetzincin family Zn-dependent metalloprotease [Thermococcus barophilus]|uniref:Archaemetzincin n=1 Tax=Thermococcus barophilus TaxID=55802 RepID=A0A0S1XAH1_THEBA|nr:archaemetzincin family Zn-dependent metalloprotease [Thermococcus barophilus]ALM74769.1 Archaemetzincin [Thermococcus barophilus]
MARLIVVPIVLEKIEKDVVVAIADYVEQFYSRFGLHAVILSEIGIDNFSVEYNWNRRQFLGRTFLPTLAQIKDTLRAGAALGITDADLYEKGLNFIFGLASPYLKVAIISLHRLRPEFYGEINNGELLKDRAIKEAMHELGHVFGLEHCPNPKCVMHFSNSILDTDLKSREYCDNCLKKLKEVFK